MGISYRDRPAGQDYLAARHRPALVGWRNQNSSVRYAYEPEAPTTEGNRRRCLRLDWVIDDAGPGSNTEATFPPRSNEAPMATLKARPEWKFNAAKPEAERT